MVKRTAADMDQRKKEGLGGEARPSLLWVWAERRAGLEGSFTHRMMVTGKGLEPLAWYEGVHRLEERGL